MIILPSGRDLLNTFLTKEIQLDKLGATGASTFTLHFVTGLNPGEVPVFAGNQFIGTVILPDSAHPPHISGFSYIEYPDIPKPVGLSLFPFQSVPATDIRRPAVTDLSPAALVGPNFASVTSHGPFRASEQLGPSANGTDLTGVQAALQPALTGLAGLSFQGIQERDGNLSFLFRGIPEPSGATSTTPEPASVLLLSTGLGWLAAQVRKKIT